MFLRDVILHQNPIVLIAKHLNPAVCANAGAAFCSANTFLVRRRIDGIGLIAGEGNHFCAERAFGDGRHVGGIHSDHLGGISKRRAAQEQKSKYQGKNLFHFVILLNQMWDGEMRFRPLYNPDAALRHT